MKNINYIVSRSLCLRVLQNLGFFCHFNMSCRLSIGKFAFYGIYPDQIVMHEGNEWNWVHRFKSGQTNMYDNY